MLEEKYLKLSKYISVPKESVECVCPYGKDPMIQFVKAATKRDCYYRVHPRKALSLIITTDGRVYTGGSLTKTYIAKLGPENFLKTTNGAYIRESNIQQMIHLFNKRLRRELKEKKESENYLNLASPKRVVVYVNMKSGYMYGCRPLKDATGQTIIGAEDTLDD